MRPLPRVPLRSTRGYNPRPLRGQFIASPPRTLHSEFAIWLFAIWPFLHSRAHNHNTQLSPRAPNPKEFLSPPDPCSPIPDPCFPSVLSVCSRGECSTPCAQTPSSAQSTEGTRVPAHHASPGAHGRRPRGPKHRGDPIRRNGMAYLRHTKRVGARTRRFRGNCFLLVARLAGRPFLFRMRCTRHTTNRTHTYSRMTTPRSKRTTTRESKSPPCGRGRGGPLLCLLPIA